MSAGTTARATISSCSARPTGPARTSHSTGFARSCRFLRAYTSTCSPKTRREKSNACSRSVLPRGIGTRNRLMRTTSSFPTPKETVSASWTPARSRSDGGDMHRLNFLDDQPWDEDDERSRTRARWFGHPFGADKLGASLRELLPGAEAGPLHMHYGVEEMFFVLAGNPRVRTPEGEETLAPGDVVYFPEGTAGLHD